MPGKFSRDKGVRGERDIVHRLPKAKRIGHSFKKTLVDVEFNGGKDVAQVKNKPIGGTAIGDILEELAGEAPGKKHWVIFKPKRGTWLICQTLEQYIGGLNNVSNRSHRQKTDEQKG